MTVVSFPRSNKWKKSLLFSLSVCSCSSGWRKKKKKKEEVSLLSFLLPPGGPSSLSGPSSNRRAQTFGAYDHTKKEKKNSSLSRVITGQLCAHNKRECGGTGPWERECCTVHCTACVPSEFPDNKRGIFFFFLCCFPLFVLFRLEEDGRERK